MSSTPERQRRPRAWPLIAEREIHVKLTDRNFLVSTAVTLLLVIGMMALQGWLSGRGESFEVAVTDQTGADVVAAAQASFDEGEEDVEVTPVRMDSRADAEAAVQDEDADAVLVRGDDGWTLAADGRPDPTLRQALTAAVRSQVLERNAAEAGTTVEELTAGADLRTEDLSGGAPGAETTRFVVGLFFAFLFYMSSIMFGMNIASSVVEEKHSRVVEIIAAAVPTSQLLVGKIVGTTALAFGQLVLVVGTGLIGSTFTGYDVLLPGTVEAVMWYLPFFVLGFLALACVWAAAGAVASRTEDLQSTTSPLTLGLILAFVVGISLDGVAQDAVSFLPILSTILMPMRILDGEVGWWEPALALLVTIAFTAATIWFGSRLYQRSVLHTQGMLGWRKAWRLGA